MTDEQLKEAISEYDSGNKIVARQILMDVVENEPANEEAWLLLSVYGETAAERFYALQQAIAINPDDQTTFETLKQYGFSREAGEAERIELFPIPAIKTNPFRGKKEYVYWDKPLDEVQAASVKGPTDEVPARGDRIPGGDLFRAGIGLLGGAILLWGMFIGILIKGQEPAFIPVTGMNSTSTVDISTTAPEIIQNSLINLPTPTYTFQLSETNRPTSDQSQTKTIQPTRTIQSTASTSPTNTIQPTSTFLSTQTQAPSRTPIPTSTFFPSPSPTIQILAGTLDNPVKAGVGYQFTGNGIMTVESSSWASGMTGIAYLLISFNCEPPASEICPTETFKFDLVASPGSVYSRENSPAIPLPSFGSIINLPTYGGSIESGYVGFSITSPESSLLLRVRNTLELGLEAYFRLP